MNDEVRDSAELDNNGNMIDIQTGEVVDVAYYRTGKQQEEYLKNKLKQKMIKNTRIGFVWFLFDRGKQIFDGKDISTTTISRVFYLATYCNYNGKLECNHELVKKQDIAKMLKIELSSFYVFWKEVTEADILFECEDGSISVNEKYFYQGRIKNNRKDFIRVYVAFMRKVYKKCNADEHKTLSHFLKLIPYINYKYNMLCTNPKETDIFKVIPISIGKCCEAIKYDSSKGRRLIDSMLEFSIHDNRMMTIGGNVLAPEKLYLYINPNLVFSSCKADKKEAETIFLKSLEDRSCYKSKCDKYGRRAR